MKSKINGGVQSFQKRESNISNAQKKKGGSRGPREKKGKDALCFVGNQTWKVAVPSVGGGGRSIGMKGKAITAVNGSQPGRVGATNCHLGHLRCGTKKKKDLDRREGINWKGSIYTVIRRVPKKKTPKKKKNNNPGKNRHKPKKVHRCQKRHRGQKSKKNGWGSVGKMKSSLGGGRYHTGRNYSFGPQERLRKSS